MINSRSQVLLVCLAADLLVLVGSGQANDVKSRTWRSSDARFSVDATLIDYSDEEVRLRKSDQKLVVVPLEKISETDVDFLSSLISNRYRVPGRLTIENVEAGGPWKVTARKSQAGRETVSVSTGSKELRRVGVTASLFDIPLAKTPNPAEQRIIAESIAAKAFQEVSVSLGEGFQGSAGDLVTERYEGKEFFAFACEYERSDGGIIYLHLEIRMIGDHAYALQFLSTNKNVGKKYRRVGRSLEVEGLDVKATP